MTDVMRTPVSTPTSGTTRESPFTSSSPTSSATSDREAAERLADAIRDGLLFATPEATTRRGTARTPGSGGAKTPTFAFGDVDCAVCQSPLDRSRPEASDNPDKVELVTGLACRHVFHRCCLVECRMHGIGRCPTCQAPLPRGFTPESVREERERHRIRDRIIARSRRATDAIRLARARAIANGTIPPHGASPTTSDGSQTPGTPVMVSLSQDTGMDVYGAAALPPRAPRTSAPRNGETARSHPYASPSPSRSPSSASEDGDDDTVLISMTQ